MVTHHIFDTRVAKHLNSIECAILFYNLTHWIAYNQANRKNYYDGCYWTYNSARAYSELFPYMHQRNIARYLKKLEDFGYIKSAKYNPDNRNKTKWYAIGQNGTIFNQNDIKTPNLPAENQLEPTPQTFSQNVLYDSNINDDETPSSSNSHLWVEFQKLWELYPPKKINIQECYAEFLTQRETYSFEQMQTGLDHLLEHIKINCPKNENIKNTLTWFKKAGWLDVFPLKNMIPATRSEPMPEWLMNNKASISSNSDEIAAKQRIEEMKLKMTNGQSIYGESK